MKTPDGESARWLEYFRDLGYSELWSAPQGRPANEPEPPVEERRTEAEGDQRRGAAAGAERGVASAAGPPVSAPPLTPAADPHPGKGAGAEPPEVADSLEELQSHALTCTACALAEGRRKVVFGSGDPKARLMLIGEGPGQREDEQGLPFVGPAGELLTRILGAIDRSREEVYITNVVKCRPPRNRDPEPAEVQACRGFLEQQIDFIQPDVILALGRVAAQSLLGTDRPLGRLRGEWHSVRGVPTRVTYHPAALLRNSSFRAPTWEDVQIVRDRLDEGKGGANEAEGSPS